MFQRPLAQRQGQVEPGLRADALAAKRWIERQRPKTGFNNQITIGLEPRRQGPVHLRIVKNINVGIDHKYMLGIRERTHDGGDSITCLTRNALANRDPDIEASAR